MSALNAIQLSFKIPTAGAPLPLRKVIPVFHTWIQQQALPGILIDVADYSHMHQGPGVLLMAHGESYSVDETFGEQGLLYVRKRGAPPTDPATGVRNALTAALRACALLEQHPDLRAGFDLTRIQFRIHNRLEAQNTAATFGEVQPLLQATLSELFDAPVTLSHDDTSRELFTLRCESEVTLSVSQLLQRLTGEAHPTPPQTPGPKAGAPNLIQVLPGSK
jgi:hypothetical protein